uniref:Uncharacterized protein n=2 Tax=Oryza TaxID=4527 RepID=A0A0E0BJ73_9ORYZ
MKRSLDGGRTCHFCLEMGACYVDHLLKAGNHGVHGLRSQKMLVGHGRSTVLYSSKMKHLE